MNDLNILSVSSIYKSILEGKLLPSYSYKINNNDHKSLYYLVDGIYPEWAIFIDTIRMATTRKEQFFSAYQESMRKDVERAFGVLLSRWHILQRPCMFYDRARCVKVMKTAIIMHNMIVEARRDGYESQLFAIAEEAVSRNGNFIDEDGNEKTFQWDGRSLMREGTDLVKAEYIDERHRLVSDEVAHYALKYDLVDHIWINYGST